ncbi:response regulator [Roseospira visakhapatnamensis]|uniref:CheY-like chemotaxis protein n=1 Tax=Roseospira visakhapatnamensis TaxID=390880 RepID=A0A7W6RDS6_9PROT|nr:response regulator [Roseospira visakhapatnamensis]MBB4266490.1 CheY-like chemotaxis protein [Roseospira visakhapatnamensis]
MKAIDILLVEDNPADADLTREYFEDARILNRLHVVADGIEAMDFLKRRGRFADAPVPDLMLLDLNLPKMDGRQVLAEIKQDPALMKIPVVVLSASKAEADIIRTYELHANAYVTKPVDLEQFAEIVQSIEGFWLSIVKLPSRND